MYFSQPCLSRWVVAAVAAVLAQASAAADQAHFPEKPVETIVPYSIGGGVGAMARAFATEAAKVTGQPWVVSPREGAGGVVGFTYLSRAKPDGYSVVFSPASPMTNAPFINASMPFQNAQIQPVCQVFENVFTIAVGEKSPIQNFSDLVARARANPGSVSFGHAGPGSVGHLSVAAVERALKVKFNAIAYRGDAPAITDSMGGTLDFSAPAISSIAGKNQRVLAVLSEKRHPGYPDVPSIAELGVPSVTPGLNGLFVPAGTPAPVIEDIERLCEKVTTSAAFSESAKTLMQVPQFLSATAFRARIDAVYKSNAALVPDLKLEKN